MPAPGLKQAPATLGASPLFSGAAAGSQGKRSLRGAQGSAEGDTGTWAQLFPQVQKCFQVWWSGAAPVCPPCVGTKEGAPNLGRFPEEHSALRCRRHRLAGLHSRAESPVLSHCSRGTGSTSPFQDTPDEWRKTEMLLCVRRYLSRT